MRNLLIVAAFFAQITSSLGFEIIAHRGASGYLPEHTLEAYTLAHAFEPDYIEIDLVLTKDGVPIGLHDITLEETTNVAAVYPKRFQRDAEGKKTWYAIDFSWAEIQKLKVNERRHYKNGKPGQAYFPSRFPLGDEPSLRVPSFEDFIKLIKGLNHSRKKSIGIYPELKAADFHLKYFGPRGSLGKKRFEDIVEEQLVKYRMKTDEVMLQSFSPESLQYLERKKSPYPRVQLMGRPEHSAGSGKTYADLITKEGLETISSYAAGVGPPLPLLADFKKLKPLNSNEFVKNAHEAGLVVHAYTLRADQLPAGLSMKKMLRFLQNKLKIDGVFTDHPDQVK